MAGIIAAVSDEGVELLNSWASSISEAIEKINSLTGSLSSCIEEHPDTLGPHRASLANVIEEIEENTKSATAPANDIAEILVEIADGYQDIIDDDNLAGAGAGGNL